MISPEAIRQQSIKFPKDLAQQARVIAAITDTSFNAVVVKALEDYVRRNQSVIKSLTDNQPRG